MGKYKAKAIRVDLGIFTHILAYSSIFRYIQVSSGITRHTEELFGNIQNTV